MYFFNRISFNAKQTVAMAIISMFMLTACGSSKEEDKKTTNNLSVIKFYNASKDSPAIFFTVDENLEDNKKDQVEITFKGIEYTQANKNYEIKPNNYFYEVAWQNNDSNERKNLKVFDEGSFTVNANAMQLVVLSNSIATPKLNFYNIPILDNKDDKENKRFNLRILNTHTNTEGIDVYISNNNETFNEAKLIGEYSYTELSENKKFNQGSYIFYITKAGQKSVLFKSKAVKYEYPAQYTMVVRENFGAGSSPYAIDKVANSFTKAYLDADAVAKFSAYNAIKTHTLLPSYNNKVDIDIRGIHQNRNLLALEKNNLSELLILNNGDYSIDIKASEKDTYLLRNHLLSLDENSSKTFFFYLTENEIDTNDDGKFDDIAVKVNSLIVNNSARKNLYDHTISIINLIEDKEFKVIKFYFVRDNETISSASLTKSVEYAKADSVVLRNNTYQVYAIAEVDGSSIILSSFEIIIDEKSNNMFMVVETNVDTVSGYKINIINQSK